MSLFYKQSQFKVQHEQITIKRGMYTYEYQIPSAYSVAYNSKTVGVLYNDFDEIYLFDLETNEPICSVKQKNDIYGSAGDQNEQDTENLYKSTERSKETKSKQIIKNKSDTINPSTIDTPQELVRV